MQSFIAAGFDPAQFWKLTPRMYQIHMRGAADRAKHERALAWSSAMLPYMKKPPSFEEFTGHRRSRAEELQACVAAWDRIDRALMANRKAH